MPNEKTNNRVLVSKNELKIKQLINFGMDGFDKEKFERLFIKFNGHTPEDSTAMRNDIFERLRVIVKRKEMEPFQFCPSFSYLFFISSLFRSAQYDMIIPNNFENTEASGYSRSKTHPFNEISKILERNQLLFCVKPNLAPVGIEDVGKAIYVPALSKYPNIRDYQPENLSKRSIIRIPTDYIIDPDEINLEIFNHLSTDWPNYEFSENSPLVEGANCYFLQEFAFYAFCMSNKNFGSIAFTLHSYLRMNTGKFRDGYDRSIRSIAADLCLSPETVQRYLILLKSHSLLKFDSGVSGSELQIRRSATYYSAERFKELSLYKIEYKKSTDKFP